MKIIYWKNNKLKFCGLTILKIKDKPDGTHLYLFKIPLGKVNSRLTKLQKKISENKDFDMRGLDAEIASIVANCSVKNTPLLSQNIAFLASCCCDMGGHTKCIRDLMISLGGFYKTELFLTKKSETLKTAPNFISAVTPYTKIYGIDSNFINFKKKAKDFANKIIDFQPSCLMIYIHPDDIFGTAVIALIKKHTQIKIIYCDHASHYPSLGISFADMVLEGSESIRQQALTKKHAMKCEIIPLQSLPKDTTIYYTKEQLNKLKKQMGIPEKCFVTMSGGHAYKFFDNDNASAYFEMIKSLLKEEPNLYHVLISQFTEPQSKLVNKIFQNNKEEESRLIVIPFQKEFDIYFQCADVFIDSFPVSSALTQIDLMRNKVASVVKINTMNPEFSFHEYQMADYPYMFENIEDMKAGIIELLHNKAKREEIIAKNYNYWLKTYENSIVRDKFIEIIKGIC